jgi:hypothetical protein
VALIFTQAAAVVVLGALHQLVAVTAAVAQVLMELVLLVLRTRAVVVQVEERQQEMLLEAQEVLDL